MSRSQSHASTTATASAVLAARHPTGAAEPPVVMADTGLRAVVEEVPITGPDGLIPPLFKCQA
jgi:hypothetical protein